MSSLHGYFGTSVSGQAHASLDEVQVNLRTNGHAVLELVLVVTLRAFGLNVLLDGVDLRLVLDQLLLNIIEPVVDLVTQYLVLLRVVLHRVQRDLFGQVDLVNLHKLLHSL